MVQRQGKREGDVLVQIWNIKGTMESVKSEVAKSVGYGTILSEQDYELWKMREQIEKFVENHKVKTVM